MKKTTKTKKCIKSKRNIFIRIVLLAFLSYMLITCYNIKTLRDKSAAKVQEQKQKIEELQLSNKAKESILNNPSKKDIIEIAARDRLGYAYPDEKVFVDISGK